MPRCRVSVVKAASHPFVHDDDAQADLFALIGRKFVLPAAARP
jgi:hypothetical protein